MWAMPMVALYVFSLGLAKVVTNVRRRGAAETDGTGADHIKWLLLRFAAVLTVVAVATASVVNQGGFQYMAESVYPTSLQSFAPTTAAPRGGRHRVRPARRRRGRVAIAAGVGLLILLGYTVRVLQAPVYP